MVRNRNQAPHQHHKELSQARRRISTVSERLLVPKSESLLRNRQKSWLTSLIAIAILLSSAGVVTGGIWLSIQLFINPDAAIWQVNQLLPWAKIPLVNGDQPQTLAQIQASIQQLGHMPGEPLPLETGAKTLLLPVRGQQQNCQTNCEQIIELRVYQLASSQYQKSPKEIYYQLVSQLPIEGLEESFVITPIVDTETYNYGSTRPLPLRELRRFEETPAGVWLYLWGEQAQGTNAIAYGYIVHYNPNRHLSLILPWTSPGGQPPQWQQVTNGGSLELVIDLSVDLEPQLQVYQVKPPHYVLDSIDLEPELEQISLTAPALNSRAYQNAILIARSGLWSPAWKWLQFIKQNQKSWSIAAQAQVDLVRLHAEYTHSQAEKTWSSPSQEVLVNLIDGRWGEALQVFQASPENTQEIAMLLAADRGQLENRVAAALRVNSARTEVKAWGALLWGAKEGTAQAIAWLKQQPQTTPANVIYIQNLLRRLEGDFSSAQTSSARSSRIVGFVEPVQQVDLSQWLQINPKIPLQLLEQQKWYQIQITAYHDGKQWQRSPFSTTLKLPSPAKFLWHHLGLNLDPEINIIIRLPDGTQQTTTARVKAVQVQGGVLRLLAAGETTTGNTSNESKALAITKSAGQWLQPEAITLAQLSQQQPAQFKTILPILWRELQKSNPSNNSPLPSFESMSEQLGSWAVQLIDLTGNAKPEIVLTVSADAVTTLNNFDAATSKLNHKNLSQNWTLIFSDTGSLLKSEFNSFSHLRAIADLKDGQPPALLIEDRHKYYFQRWSVPRQRFE